MRVALITGAFDPLLAGQAALIGRASALWARVVVGVEAEPSHRALFPLEERVERLRTLFAGNNGIEVRPYAGDFPALARETGAAVYVVGLRSGADVQAVLNKSQLLCRSIGLDLVGLLAEPAHAFVTTALVRDVARLGGDISPFLP